MNREILNRVKLHFEQGQRELESAKHNINIFYEGKIRTLARRSAGFYLEGYVNFTNKIYYGNSFMNHLKGLQNDNTIPIEIKNSANALTMKMKNEDLSGPAAIENAEIIINFCREELNKFLIQKK